MAYKDEELFEGILKRYSGSSMQPFVRSAKRAVKLGQETGQSAAENLRALADVRDWKSGAVERAARKLSKIPTTAIDSQRYSYLEPIVQSAYETVVGRSATPEEVSRNIGLAGASRINPSDPGAFTAFMSDVLLSSPEGRSKYKTEADLTWESQYGTMPRDAQGNLIRGMVRYNPGQVKNMIQSMIG